MMIAKKIGYEALREFLRTSVGCTEFVGPNFVRFDHPATKSVVVLRRYLPEESVRDLDLAMIRKTFVERGAVPQESLEEFLNRSSAMAEDEFDFLLHLFFLVCELGEALQGKKVMLNRLRMEAFDLPYDANFHRLAALDELMRDLQLNGRPLPDWSTNLSAKKYTRQTRSVLKKIGEAIHPLIYSPKRDQANVKNAAFDKLGAVALELKNELEARSNSFGSLASDIPRIWPTLTSSL